MSASTLKRYVVEQFRRETVTTRNGHCRATPGGWYPVLEIEAPREGKALSIADAKWPAYAGKHRARLIQTALHPAHAQLCADDRAIIHQLTQTTI